MEQKNELLIKGSKVKVILAWLGCFAFVAAGLLMIKVDNHPFGYISVGFFGLGILVLPLMIFSKQYIKITSEGIEQCATNNKWLIKWDEIEGFGEIGGGNIGIRLNARALEERVAKGGAKATSYLTSKRMTGFHEGISAMYKVKPKKLLNTLNQWKEKYPPNLVPGPPNNI